MSPRAARRQLEAHGPEAPEPADGLSPQGRGFDLELWLTRLRRAVQSVREGGAVEAVHELRVATARLRVGLALGSRSKLRRELRWLRRRAGPVRDLDVRLAQSPPRSVALALLKQQERARRKLQRTLEGARLRALLAQLRALPPTPHRRARAVLARLAKTALRRGRAVESDPRDDQAMHRLRRAVRNVRFALEWLGRPATELAALQDTMGDVCDRALALRALEDSASHARGVRAFRDSLAHALRVHRRAARKQWAHARGALEALARS